HPTRDATPCETVRACKRERPCRNERKKNELLQERLMKRHMKPPARRRSATRQASLPGCKEVAYASRKVCNGGRVNTWRKPAQPPTKAHSAPSASPAIHSSGLNTQ